MNLVKIETQIDVLNLNQVQALNEFLSVIGGHSLPSTFTPAIPAQNVVAPKTRTKKSEAVQEPETIEATEVANEIEVKEPEVVKAPKEEILTVSQAPTLMQIRSLVSEKAKDHKEAIKAKLTELGAQNVSTLDPEHFSNIHQFLKDL